MTFGHLIHSEIWNNLSHLGFENDESTRVFEIILEVDSIYSEHVEKQENKRKATESKNKK